MKTLLFFAFFILAGVAVAALINEYRDYEGPFMNDVGGFIKMGPWK